MGQNSVVMPAPPSRSRASRAMLMAMRTLFHLASDTWPGCISPLSFKRPSCQKEDPEPDGAQTERDGGEEQVFHGRRGALDLHGAEEIVSLFPFDGKKLSTVRDQLAGIGHGDDHGRGGDRAGGQAEKHGRRAREAGRTGGDQIGQGFLALAPDHDEAPRLLVVRGRRLVRRGEQGLQQRGRDRVCSEAPDAVAAVD